MADEYDNNPPTYSSFWPLLILLVGLIIFFGYQDYVVNVQRTHTTQDIQDALPALNAAQNWQGRYNALMQDLIQTGGKDATAAQIAKDAVRAGIQAGLIRVNQTPASTGTNAAPAAPAAPAPAK